MGGQVRESNGDSPEARIRAGDLPARAAALGPTATDSARTSMHKLTQALPPAVPSNHAATVR